MGSSYIHNVAKTMMGTLGITKADLEKYGVQSLYERRGDEIKVLLLRMKPETLGRIAACGRGDGEVSTETPTHGTTLYQVHCGTYLRKYDTGLDLLREIACTAIVAAMGDVMEWKSNINHYTDWATSHAPAPR